MPHDMSNTIIKRHKLQVAKNTPRRGRRVQGLISHCSIPLAKSHFVNTLWDRCYSTFLLRVEPPYRVFLSDHTQIKIKHPQGVFWCTWRGSNSQRGRRRPLFYPIRLQVRAFFKKAFIFYYFYINKSIKLHSYIQLILRKF